MNTNTPRRVRKSAECLWEYLSPSMRARREKKAAGSVEKCREKLVKLDASTKKNLTSAGLEDAVWHTVCAPLLQ